MAGQDLVGGRGRFTQTAEEVTNKAMSDAKKIGQSIQPEHLLLALLTNRKALGLAIVQALGVDVPKLIQQLQNSASLKLLQTSTDVMLSDRFIRAGNMSIRESQRLGSARVGTEHILLGILSEGTGDAAFLLSQHGVTLFGVHRALRTLSARDGDAVPLIRLENTALFKSGPLATLRGVPVRVSPIFFALIGVTVLGGTLAYFQLLIPQLNVFLFVAGGWMISLCLHEFGHALVAYIGGDTGVVSKGYLTLNPLKYTHVVLSIVLPLVFLVLGGIGLPGGAVFINRAAIRGRGMNSLVSAAGPIATATCALALLFPFLMGIPQSNWAVHPEFWGGYAFLTWLEIFALFINLLPIPGLDGFGIIAPYLPDRIVYRLYGLGNIAFFILFLLISTRNPFAVQFFEAVFGVLGLFGVDRGLVEIGRALFSFRAIR